MNLTALLWHLQVVDQEIDDKTKRLRQVDAAIVNDPVLATARASFDIAEKQLHEWHSQFANRELEAKGLDAKIKELNDRLYSGRMTNPKELDGYAKDLEMHKRNRSLLDDKLLELMDSVDRAQKQVDEKSNALKQIEAKRASDLDHLTKEHAALATRLTELATHREQTRASLGSDPLRTYERLRQTKAGRAVVQLKRDSCGACGVTVPTGQIQRIHTGDEIIYCSSCGRILAP